MGSLGLLGVTVSENCSGAGMNHVCYGLVAREVERMTRAIARCCLCNPLCKHPIESFGSEAQKQKYLPGWPPANG